MMIIAIDFVFILILHRFFSVVLLPCTFYYTSIRFTQLKTRVGGREGGGREGGGRGGRERNEGEEGGGISLTSLSHFSQSILSLLTLLIRRRRDIQTSDIVRDVVYLL